MSKATTTSPTGQRVSWTGQYGFLMAAIGAAVGLGNIWRFPGIAYNNGGGAFLLPYLVSLLCIGLPILLLEYALGHKYRGSAPLAFRRFTKKAEFLGWWQVAISAVTSIYYALVIAWAISYMYYSINLAWEDDALGFFLNSYLQVDTSSVASFTPVIPVLIPLLLVWVVSSFVISRGVTKGVELANKIFMPLLVVLFLIIVVRALFLPDAISGINAFFTPDWEAISDGKVWLSAFSQIFFSLSIACAIMTTYASYMPRRFNITGTGLVAGFANSAFEILAGIGVFAVLGFMSAQQGAAIDELAGVTGANLSFITFPTIISLMPGGPIFGVLFFASLALAGITSQVSNVQAATGAFEDKFGWSAKRSSLILGSIMAVVSVAFFATTTGITTLDIIDAYINDIGLVGGAIAMAVLAVFVRPRLRGLRMHLNATSSIQLPRIWEYFVGIIAPLAIGVMLVVATADYIANGYSDHAADDPRIIFFGWGCLIVTVIFATVMSLLKWNPKVQHEPVINFVDRKVK
ncbi:sodium-dependent transporter [Canibacter sp. lx-72]|uniref:sodium-dependent transporter n=1 Tax=Canibacter zhuwentaonis TaxID=2837491 RepID=UPI001BDC4CBD|nr:sodium-dependent transporter [Canibacter zhuwentaonis]MBT1018566.1 sodium-dependent transporter [Canibacter zhuwentaonis]MBT1035761.1 sodium-dependent transporter [Canibacter zhuwentaonis]